MAHLGLDFCGTDAAIRVFGGPIPPNPLFPVLKSEGAHPYFFPGNLGHMTLCRHRLYPGPCSPGVSPKHQVSLQLWFLKDEFMGKHSFLIPRTSALDLREFFLAAMGSGMVSSCPFVFSSQAPHLLFFWDETILQPSKGRWG